MSFNKITKPLSKNPKILTVASLPKEGKTTAFAGIKDVLIVDCDADDGLNYIDPAMIGNEPSYYQCSSIAEFKELVAKLKATTEANGGKSLFKVIVLDTVNLAYEKLAKDIGLAIENSSRKLDGKGPVKASQFNSLPYGRAWLAKAEALTQIFDKLSEYCETLIVAGHLIAIEIDGQQVLTINLPGKLKEKLPGLATANSTFRTDPENPNRRILSFVTDMHTIAGSRIPRLAGKEIIISEKDPKTGKFTFGWDEILLS